MNWQEIKEKYPKAWVKAVEWKGELKLKMLFLSVNMYRDLYDFFDEQEIYVTIQHLPHGSPTPIGCTTGWWYLIDNRTYENNWITRKEAEEAAFMKAFGILEEKL